MEPNNFQKIELHAKDIPSFVIGVAIIDNVRIGASSSKFENDFENVVKEIKSKENIEKIKDNPIIRAYRDFYWKHIGIDPTKIRPSSEALIRRILRNKRIPRINSAVDAYNLASIETYMSFGAYDAERIQGNLILRKANENEEFLGIGMREPINLKGNELVLADNLGPINVYPYRDSDRTKVTEHTRRILLICASVPGIPQNTVEQALQTAIDKIKKYCVGNVEYNDVYMV